MDVREQLLEAAVKVFAQAGFRGATTRRIAQEAGVNEVTLFRQFGSKEGLILEAVLRAVTRLQDEAVLPDIPRDPAAELLDWTRRHYEFMRGNARLIKAAMADAVAHPDMGCLGDRISSSIEQTLRGYLGRLRAAGLCDPDIDIAVAGNVLGGVVFADAMGRDVHPQCYAYSPAEAPERYVAFFLRAIGARGSLAARAAESEAVVHHA
ncbi:TetR/AcrR family transcriptional regulator [Luteitalea sp. TBR-22]|uniref:TetR/AcrR family transcriptional regulator n=1 Tax=Luteitalea sp. TBR-22 TaxID=2802971 RepID=UPI001EF41628|nr:TetR/AcrR family transcriptional regulator [Luteitalea sp. TBR-22]